MFESSLIALEEKKHRRHWTPLPIAVGLHLAVLASVGLAQVWNVDAVGEPEMKIIYIDHPAPPPLAPAGGSPTPPAPTEAPVTPPTTPVQPDMDVIPDTPPADSTPVTAVDLPFVPGGSPDGDGVQGGVTDGTPGGDPDSEAGRGSIGWTGPVVEPQPREEIVRYNGTMTRPVKLSGRQPRYTELARRAGVQGTVILEAVIDKKGRVSNVRVLKGLPMGLDAEAVAAVKDWVFDPADMDGRPVAVYYTLTVHFEVLR
jgi:protein TonB